MNCIFVQQTIRFITSHFSMHKTESLRLLLDWLKDGIKKK
jgi:hypothetical protein